MTRIFIISIFLFTSMSFGNEVIKIDTSNHKTIKKTILEIKKSLSPKKSKEFDKALKMIITRIQFIFMGKSAETMELEFAKIVDEKTADNLIELRYLLLKGK